MQPEPARSCCFPHATARSRGARIRRTRRRAGGRSGTGAQRRRPCGRERKPGGRLALCGVCAVRAARAADVGHGDRPAKAPEALFKSAARPAGGADAGGVQHHAAAPALGQPVLQLGGDQGKLRFLRRSRHRFTDRPPAFRHAPIEALWGRCFFTPGSPSRAAAAQNSHSMAGREAAPALTSLRMAVASSPVSRPACSCCKMTDWSALCGQAASMRR